MIISWVLKLFCSSAPMFINRFLWISSLSIFRTITIIHNFTYKGKKSFQFYRIDPIICLICLNSGICEPKLAILTFYWPRFLSAEATIRDKYHKCFTCNLTGMPSKIYKIRTRLKVKVLENFTNLQSSLFVDAGLAQAHHRRLHVPSPGWSVPRS